MKKLPTAPSNPLLRLLSSYAIGLVVLLLMMVLLVLGTLWQAEYGLFRAQRMFYHSYLFMYPVGDRGLGFPLPGARLLMIILFINLLCATIFRMRPRRQIIGVYIVHAGILVLLAGGFLTAYWSYEGYMRIEEGQASNFSERFQEEEIAIVRKGAEVDDVTAIHNIEHVAPGTVLYAADESIPFTLEVVEMMRDSELYIDEENAFAEKYGITEEVSRGLSIGPVSRGNAEAKLLAGVFRLIPGDGGEPSVFILSDRLVEPLRLRVDGEQWEISLRDRRDYYPFSLYLRDFRQASHPGTRIAASYESDVTLVHPAQGIDGRDIRIYMNHPLRYDFYTFYQASFEGDTVTVLQVVMNKGLIFPYLATIIVSIGLIWQFVQVLISRARVQRHLVKQMDEEAAAAESA